MTGDRVQVTHLRRPWRWLARCALVVLVLWCAGYAVWDAHDRAVWRARGVAAVATVTEESCDGEGSFLRLDVRGTSRVVLPCPDDGLRVGDRVAVLDDAAHPDEVRLVEAFDRTSGRVSAVVAAVTTAVLAVLEWTWRRERRALRAAS